MRLAVFVPGPDPQIAEEQSYGYYTRSRQGK